MKHTQEELAGAKNEGRIEPAQLACEILPLLKDYMIGEFSAEKASIILHFLNGDNFELTIKAI